MRFQSQPYYYTQHDLQRIVDGHIFTVEKYVAEGWLAFLLTFMFHHIPGRPQDVLYRMEKEIYRVYTAAIKWDVKQPRLAKNKDRVSKLILCEDYPVPKGQKGRISGISINGGKHFGGVALVPPWSEMPERLDTHFKYHQAVYARPNCADWLEYPLMRVRADPIFERPGYVMEYGLKSVLRRRVDPGDILLYPKAQSEFKTLPVDPRKLTGGGVF